MNTKEIADDKYPRYVIVRNHSGRQAYFAHRYTGIMHGFVYSLQKADIFASAADAFSLHEYIEKELNIAGAVVAKIKLEVVEQ